MAKVSAGFSFRNKKSVTGVVLSVNGPPNDLLLLKLFKVYKTKIC